MSEVDIYEGSSKSIRNLVNGYWSYAEETITNRNLPDIRDGLKTVQRRILFAMYDGGSKKYWKSSKSANVVGAVMPFHPHGDAAIYQAAARMTRSNGSWSFSPLMSNGDLGDHFGNSPAQSRYTEMYLGDDAKEYFDFIDGVPMKNGELNEMEPEFLPVRFPVALVNSQSGIAVGMSSNIPGYNFWDVIDMTERVVRGESLVGRYYAPDLATGGVLVDDREQFQKVLTTGRGMIMVRSRVAIKGDTIHVLDLAPTKTVDSIRALLNRYMEKSDPDYMPELRGADDNTGITGFDLAIICKRGTAQHVLLELCRRSILQQNIRVNLLFTNNATPTFGSVEKLIKEWEEARKQVLTTSFNRRLEADEAEVQNITWLLKLLENEPARDRYVDLLVHDTMSNATQYLESVLDGIPAEVAKWISSRRAVEFNKATKFNKRYYTLQDEIKTYRGYLNDLDGYILNDLASLREKYKGRFPRRTELTETVYKFKKAAKKDLPSEISTTWVTVTKSGVVYKTEDKIRRNGILYQGVLDSSDTIVGFDNSGNLIRVYMSMIPDTDKIGYRLTEYLGISNASSWRLMYADKLDGEDRVLLFDDGYVSTLHCGALMEHSGHRKLIRTGVSELVGKYLVDVFRKSELPDVIVALDDEDASKIGWEYTSNIKPTKSDSARVPFITGGRISKIGGGTLEDLAELYKTDEPNYEKTHHKFKYDPSIDMELASSMLQVGSYVQQD